MIYRAFRYRLYPTPEQESRLRQISGVTRLVYNLAWEQRVTWHRQYRAATGRPLNYVSQGLQVTDLRREFDWMRAVPSGCLTQALRDLDSAYDKFFRGQGGYPSPRKRGRNDSFRVPAAELARRGINSRWGEVRMAHLGWVRFRSTRPIAGKVISATFSHGALGWHVAVTCEIEHETPANDNPDVGIDRGVAISLALSNGEAINLPDLSRLDKRRRRAQRALARCQRGSRRRVKQKLRVARIAGRIARVRADWQHRVSLDIAGRFGTVVIEDLKVASMTAAGSTAQKRGLNRSIMGQAWSSLADKLAYKLEERGGALVKVNPAYTSQTCSDCGTVDSRSRESQASFACVECGFRANADHNAAIVILRRRAPPMPVEDAGYGPCEAGTCREAA